MLTIILMGALGSLTIFSLSVSIYARRKKKVHIPRRRLVVLGISVLTVILASSLAFRTGEELLILFMLVFTPFAIYEAGITLTMCDLSKKGVAFITIMITIGAILIALIPIITMSITANNKQQALESVDNDFNFYLVAAAKARGEVEKTMDLIAMDPSLIQAIEEGDAEKVYQIAVTTKEETLLDLLMIRTDALPIIDASSEIGVTQANVNSDLKIGQAYLIQWGDKPFTIISGHAIENADGHMIGIVYGGTIVDQARSRAFAELLEGNLSLLRSEGTFYYSGELEETQKILNHIPMETLCTNTAEPIWLADTEAYIRVLPMVRDNLPADCITYGVSIIISPSQNNSYQTTMTVGLIDTTLTLITFVLFYNVPKQLMSRYPHNSPKKTKKK